MNNHYQRPLDVDKSVAERKIIFRQRRANAATSYAGKAGRMFSNVLLNTKLAHPEVDPIELSGGEVGIRNKMHTYQVFRPLVDYATRVAMRLYKEKLAAARERGEL